MTGLRITACLGLIVWTTLTSSAQSAPSSAPSTSATSAREAPQGPAAPDTPAYSTAPAQDGSTGDGMIAPDTRPLSGAQPFTLGISGQKRDGDLAASIAVVGLEPVGSLECGG